MTKARNKALIGASPVSARYSLLDIAFLAALPTGPQFESCNDQQQDQGERPAVRDIIETTAKSWSCRCQRGSDGLRHTREFLVLVGVPVQTSDEKDLQPECA